MYDMTKVSDISILHLYGEISLMEMEMIATVIQSLKKCDHHKILLDLAQVDHVHFQAVKGWVKEAEDLRWGSGDLRLVGLTKKTREVFQFTGADQYLRDFSSMADAILSFLKAPVKDDSVDDTRRSGDSVTDEAKRRRKVSEAPMH
jgi:anti-anti-sigma factor